MKKLAFLFIFFLSITHSTQSFGQSTQSFGQIDVSITDLKNSKTVPFSEIHDVYKLNKQIPTIVVSWSGIWCYPCLRLINRYNNSDLSMINVITVNIDSENELSDVLGEGYHLNWNKSLNFHANIGEKRGGFDSVFNISNAPLILILDNGSISYADVNYNLFPYVLIKSGLINDIKFIWNNWEDLNSLAWDYYQSETDTAKLEEAKKWVIRSIELDVNYYNLDTYAALLFKTGDLTDALKMAKQAIEFAKIEDVDYDPTTKLINEIIEKL
ncbi:tetratricopeptide repeat protein [Robiginitalea biformata]|uniref:tetratricopeptide repeat protein n=1 Tax=Robiginitalea biformata TaxID=252307 RepID=UPI003B5A3441